MFHVGIDPDKAATSDAEFGLGDIGVDKAGNFYQYVEADENIAVNEAVVIASDYGVTGVDATSTGPTAGQGKPVGVAMVALTSASTKYGWVARHGTSTSIKVLVAASCAAYTELNSTATQGTLDDSAANEVINGIVVITADGGSGSAIQAVLNWPYVGRNLS